MAFDHNGQISFFLEPLRRYIYLPRRGYPDGRRIAFANARAGDFDVFVTNVDGSGIVPVTDAAVTVTPRAG